MDAVDRAEDEAKRVPCERTASVSLALSDRGACRLMLTKKKNKQRKNPKEKPSFTLVQKRQLARTQQVSLYCRRQKICVPERPSDRERCDWLKAGLGSSESRTSLSFGPFLSLSRSHETAMLAALPKRVRVSSKEAFFLGRRLAGLLLGLEPLQLSAELFTALQHTRFTKLLICSCRKRTRNTADENSEESKYQL